MSSSFCLQRICLSLLILLNVSLLPSSLVSIHQQCYRVGHNQDKIGIGKFPDTTALFLSSFIVQFVHSPPSCLFVPTSLLSNTIRFVVASSRLLLLILSLWKSIEELKVHRLLFLSFVRWWFCCCFCPDTKILRARQKFPSVIYFKKRGDEEVEGSGWATRRIFARL